MFCYDHKFGLISNQIELTSPYNNILNIYILTTYQFIGKHETLSNLKETKQQS
jgi:hypothetical protein